MCRKSQHMKTVKERSPKVFKHAKILDDKLEKSINRFSAARVATNEKINVYTHA